MNKEYNLVNLYSDLNLDKNLTREFTKCLNKDQVKYEECAVLKGKGANQDLVLFATDKSYVPINDLDKHVEKLGNIESVCNYMSNVFRVKQCCPQS